MSPENRPESETAAATEGLLQQTLKEDEKGAGQGDLHPCGEGACAKEHEFLT